MKLKQTFLSLCGIAMLWALTTNLNAQVTIGSTEKPIDGALLQLTEGTVTKRGLGMPRVLLTKKKNLIDIDPSNATRPDPDKHTGLVVYNSEGNLCADLYTGINVWDGTQWQPIPHQEIEVFTDVMIDNRDPAKPETYKISKFGDAGWWMVENLRAITWPNNTIASGKTLTKAPVSNAGISIKTAFFQNPNFNTNIIEYGLLYNWVAAVAHQNTATDVDQNNVDLRYQGICPDGWHLPNMIEFRKLMQEIEDNPCVYGTDPAAINVGNNMRTPDKVSGSVTETGGKSRPINEGGFNAYLPGYIFSEGSINPITARRYGEYGAFYSSCVAKDNVAADQSRSPAAYDIYLDINRAVKGENHPTRAAFFSVRCKRD